MGNPPTSGTLNRPEPPTELTRSREIARILDGWFRIPGTQIRVGLDPLLGLLPGVGDWIGWIASSHLLLSAWRLKASASTLLRMTGHLVIDAVVGTVPVLGDLFDIGWRANTRNLAILEQLAAHPEQVKRESRLFVGGLLGTIGMVVLGAGWVAWKVMRGVLEVFAIVWAGGI